MRKILTIAVMALGLAVAGCNDPEPIKLTVEKWRVVEVPESLYARCPEMKPMPNWKTLTDRQVAILIKDLYNTSVSCRNALLAVRDYVRTAKSELDNKPIY